MANDNSVTWLTQEAFDRRSAELEQLAGEGRLEIAKKIEAAREEVRSLHCHRAAGEPRVAVKPGGNAVARDDAGGEGGPGGRGRGGNHGPGMAGPARRVEPERRFFC